MYKNTTESTIKIVVGTERAGLTYKLRLAKLERLNPELNEYLGNDRSTSAKDNGHSTNNYHLERSYLTWLHRLSVISTFDQEFRSAIRPPRPFVDRIHDWTFRMNPRTESVHFLETLQDLIYRLEEAVEMFAQLLTMSVAAFVYGGLHLLAWNAHFRGPVYGLLWKLSGITVASLGVLALLAVPAYRSLDWLGSHDTVERGLRRYLWRVAAFMFSVGTILFSLLYVLARVYLLVESFLSLAFLPESVLVTPNFSLYFPHIG
jgi:hypothetical protein